MSALSTRVAASATPNIDEVCNVCTKPIVGLTWITRGNFTLTERVGTCNGCFQEGSFHFEPRVAKFMRKVCVPVGLELSFVRMETCNRPTFRLLGETTIDDYTRTESIICEEGTKPVSRFWPIRKTKNTATIVLQDPNRSGCSSMRYETLFPGSRWRVWLRCVVARVNEGNSCVTLISERAERMIVGDTLQQQQQLLPLVKRPADEDTTNLDMSCVVCLVSVRDTVCLPCSHMCLCCGCSQKIHKLCPMCRGKVRSYRHVFL